MIIAISGKKQSGKNTVAKILQLLDTYYNNRKLYNAYCREEKMNGTPNEPDIQFITSILSENKTIYIDNNSWINKSFANKIKEIVCILTGCTMDQLENENFKNKLMSECWKIKKYVIKNNNGLKYPECSFNKEDIKQYLDYFQDSCRKKLHIESEEFIPTYRWMLQNIGTEAFRNNINPNTWINALFADYKPINGIYPNWIITDLRFPNELEECKKRGSLNIRVERNACKNLEKEHSSEIALDNYKNWDYIIENNNSIKDLIIKVKHFYLNI